jgi:hypothetical protein
MQEPSMASKNQANHRRCFDDRSSKDRATPQPSVLAASTNQTTQAIEQGATKVDNETNSEGASGKDGGKMKVGDKVWVLCEVVDDPCHGKVKVDYCSMSFWPYLVDCKPVKPETVEQPTSDPVNPSHYNQGGIECIEAIKAALGVGFIAYLWGNILKYLWRWPNKNGIEDLKKARWYLDRLIQEEEAK